VTIRIWHQSFTVLSDLAAYDEALRSHFKRVARPDTVIDMHGMREGTYRTNYPGDDIKYVGFQFLHSIQFLQGALLAERQGYDAYALSTLPEPGLREIRTLVNIPVVGYGECAARAAVGDGRKFGALVFIPELAELFRDNVRRHGVGCRLIGANDVGFRFTDVLAGFDSPGPLIDKFKKAARELIAKGAEAIVPGEAPLNVLLAMNGVTEVDGVMIVDSLGAWVRTAEDEIDAARAGKRQAGIGYFEAIPDPVRRDEILDFYGLNPT